MLILRAAAAGIVAASVPPAAISTNGLLARWNPSYSAMATSDDGFGNTIATSMGDMVAAATASVTTAAEAPVYGVDENGRAYLDFNALAWMAFTTAVAINYQQLAVYFIGHHHRAVPIPGQSSTHILWVNDYPTANASHMNISLAGGSPYCRCINGNTSGQANAGKVIAGSQLQLLVTRASGATLRAQVNEQSVVPAGSATAGTQTNFGGLIGAASTTPVAMGGFRMYEIALYTSGFSNAEIDANRAVYLSYYNIAPTTRSVVIDGDSRFFGFAPNFLGVAYGNRSLIPCAKNPAMALATSMTNNDIRIVNIASSGNTASDLAARRNTALGMYSNPGGYVAGWVNDVHYLVGTNDQSQAPASGSPVWTTPINTVARADEAYDRASVGIIALVHTTTTGYLERGFNVYAATELARDTAADMVAIDQMRTRLTDPLFLTACTAGPGDLYDGKLQINRLDQWDVGGTQIFNLLAAANDQTYYSQDKLHFNVEGSRQLGRAVGTRLGFTLI